MNNEWSGPEIPRRPGAGWVVIMFLGLLAFAIWSLI